MGKKLNDDKKQRILEAAISLFSEKGFEKTSTREIAEKARVAEGTIFYYFKSKNDLLNILFDEGIEIMVQEIIINSLSEVIKENHDNNEREILKAVIKNRLELIQNNFPLVKIFFAELFYKEKSRERFIKIITDKGIKVITDFINKGINEGRFKDINAVIVARCLVGIVITHIIQNQCAPELLKDYTLEQQIDMMLDLFLEGLLIKREV